MNAGYTELLRLGSVALLTSMLLPLAALAKPPDLSSRAATEQISRTIDIRGLDLSAPAGAQRLYEQIVSTAKGICSRPQRHNGYLRKRQDLEHAQRCFDEAVNAALAQVAELTGTDIERVAGLDRAAEAERVVSR